MRMHTNTILSFFGGFIIDKSIKERSFPMSDNHYGLEQRNRRKKSSSHNEATRRDSAQRRNTNRSSQTKGQRPPQNKRRRRRKSAKRWFLLPIILLFLIAIPFCFIYYNISKIQTYDMDKSKIAMNQVNDSNMKNYKNILILGVDSRANELDKDTRSDSIIIASIHKKTHEITLTSVYRDTYLNVEGHDFTKITHAYAYGGPELAISSINRNLDLDIEDFVTVNFSAVANVVDLLGGVEITITEDELKYVNNYTRDVARINGTECVYLKSAGKQTLDGNQATAYCRVRYTSGGDFTRAQRQRTVLQAIFNKAKSSNPITLYQVMNEMLPQIHTSLSSSDIFFLALDAFAYQLGTDEGFPYDKSTPTIKGASVVLPTTLESNVIALHKNLFGTEQYQPTDVVIGLSNALR